MLLGMRAAELEAARVRVVEAVAAAREAGASWRQIAEAVGTSTRAAQFRYSRLIDSGDDPQPQRRP